MRATLSQHRRRGFVAGIVTTTVLALSILGGGTALAANPNWQVGPGINNDPNVPQPASGTSSSFVSAGQQVGFFEWLRNPGPSNISQLYLTANPANTTLVGAKFTIKDAGQGFVRGGTCPSATPLDCSIGALRSGQTVYVEVAFTAASSLADGATLPIVLEFNTTGAVPGSNNSHGDAKQILDSAGISKNGDAAGDYNFSDAAGLTVADDQSVGPKNPQATTVTLAAVGVGASVGDSSTLQAPPCSPSFFENTPPPGFDCATSLTSLTSNIEVGNGQTFDNNGAGTPRIKVTVLFKKAPSQLSGAHPFVYHYWKDAAGLEHAEFITQTCTPSSGFPTNTMPCLTVGNNRVTFWLFHNGGTRM